MAAPRFVFVVGGLGAVFVVNWEYALYGFDWNAIA